ncbi:MAG TPA: hypothetical protein VMV48_06930 [Gallionellaceae bacterium]|nr:hypothetical protein [Gallionellaceae bacterium]
MLLVTGSPLLTALSAAHAASMTQQAVDSSAFPETIISAADAGNKPLPYCRIAEDTYFLCGNVKAGQDHESAVRLSGFADWHNSAVS